MTYAPWPLSSECPLEQLQQLIGACFHLGELVVDAEIESALRESFSRQTSPSILCATRSGASGDRCLAGVGLLACKLLGWLQPLLGHVLSLCK